MSKTLTYFAITHNKAALGHETSKSLTTAQRVYYKLLSIESLMNQMGIKYERKSSFSEDFGAFVVGDIIVSQFGQGAGNHILGAIGGVLASDYYEKNLANMYTKLNILSNGHTYLVYIKCQLKLKTGRAVKISIDDEKISGISLLKK
jgi:hypothetical protein